MKLLLRDILLLELTFHTLDKSMILLEESAGGIFITIGKQKGKVFIKA